MPPGGHAGVVQENVKLAMAGHHGVHGPWFKKYYKHDMYKEDSFPTSREMLDLLYRGQGPEVGHASPKVLPDLVIYPGFGRLLQPRVTYSDSVS